MQIAFHTHFQANTLAQYRHSLPTDITSELKVVAECCLSHSLHIQQFLTPPGPVSKRFEELMISSKPKQQHTLTFVSRIERFW